MTSSATLALFCETEGVTLWPACAAISGKQYLLLGQLFVLQLGKQDICIMLVLSTAVIMTIQGMIQDLFDRTHCTLLSMTSSHLEEGYSVFIKSNGFEMVV